MRLAHYINPEEVDEQAKDNKLVELKYTGALSHLQGKGEGYFISNENPRQTESGGTEFLGQWYFRPNGAEDFYRVKPESLNFEA